MNINPMLMCDFYKTTHAQQFPEGTTKLVSYFTPRMSRLDGVDSVVVFGIQAFCKNYLIDYFNENFFNQPADKVEGNDAGSITSVATLINGYRNAFGKPMVLVIQSQLGVPICAYSGDNVYWEVCNDLPKTTKLMIDGKAIYVHRANFQIIDLSLL